MKKFVLSLALCAASSSLCLAVIPDWADFNRYAKANAELMAQPNNGRRVVFMGNSITDFWPDKHPEFFSSHGFIGRGISGQSSYQFLSRFRSDVINLHPKIVVINAATNDIAENTHVYDEERTFGNIISMVELARANGIDVVLTTTMPAGFFFWNKEIKDGPEKIESLNSRLKAYADEHNIPFVDYYSHMLAEDGRSMDPRYTDDGVHPTAAGYEVMEKLILEVLEKR